MSNLIRLEQAPMNGIRDLQEQDVIGFHRNSRLRFERYEYCKFGGKER